jgi:hypothetical protein
LITIAGQGSARINILSSQFHTYIREELHQSTLSPNSLPQTSTMASTLPVENVTADPAEAAGGYTLEDLKAHATAESFYMLLHDKVYDVTKFLYEVSLWILHCIPRADFGSYKAPRGRGKSFRRKFTRCYRGF